MKPLVLALTLLISPGLSGQQQLSPSADNTKTQQQTGKADDSVTLSGDKKPSHEEAAAAGQQQHGTGTIAQPSVSQKCFTERAWQRFKSLNSADKISSGLLVVTAFYLGFTIMIWRQMVKSNKHAQNTYKSSKEDTEKSLTLTRRQLEVYERPWVKASVVTDGLCFSADGSATAYFNPVIKNIGKSVASNVCVVADLVIVPVDEDQVRYAREQAMALTRANRDTFTLFPDDTDRMRLIMPRLTKTAIDSGAFTDNDGYESINLSCIGAVFYKFSTSEVDHVTRFSFILSSNSQGGGHNLFVRVGYDVPANEIAPRMNFVHHAD